MLLPYRLLRPFFYTSTGLAVAIFPIALIIYAFSGCEVRYRSAKAACRTGSLERCLEVAKTYDEKSSGLIGFLMSNGETASIYYDSACKLGSIPACNRLGEMILNSDNARDSQFHASDAVRAFEKACTAHAADACYSLGALYLDPYRWEIDEKRAAQALADACAGKHDRACTVLSRLEKGDKFPLR